MEMLAFFLSTFDYKSSPLILYMLHTYTSALVIYWYEQLNIVIQLEACLFYLITINTSTSSQCTQLNYVINVFLNTKGRQLIIRFFFKEVINDFQG